MFYIVYLFTISQFENFSFTGSVKLNEPSQKLRYISNHKLMFTKVRIGNYVAWIFDGRAFNSSDGHYNITWHFALLSFGARTAASSRRTGIENY